MMDFWSYYWRPFVLGECLSLLCAVPTTLLLMQAQLSPWFCLLNGAIIAFGCSVAVRVWWDRWQARRHVNG